MIKAVVIGFSKNEVPGIEGIVWAIFNSSSDVSGKEHLLLTKKVVKQSDVLVCNLYKGNFSLEEILFIFSAYTMDIPILGVGEGEQSLISDMMSNKFHNINDLIDHLIANYTFV